MLYIDHMLRRLNSIGREGAILNELGQRLPEDLQSLYALMLAEVQRQRTPEQYETLKKLFAWLAFSKRPLSLEEANDLIVLTGQDASFSLAEEIEGRSGRYDVFDVLMLLKPFPLTCSTRILEVSHPLTVDDEHLRDTEDEATYADHEDKPEKLEDDGAFPIRFQERSLKDYFRAMNTDESGFRTPPSSAHITIFIMCVTVLCGFHQERGKEVGNRLKEYAARFWVHHFFDIDIDTVSQETVVIVVEALANVLRNQNNASRIIELYGNPYLDDFRRPQGGNGAKSMRWNTFLDRISTWTRRAAGIDTNRFYRGTVQFVKEANAFPQRIMAPLAYAHVSNWFRQTDQEGISFKFALAALMMVR